MESTRSIRKDCTCLDNPYTHQVITSHICELINRHLTTHVHTLPTPSVQCVQSVYKYPSLRENDPSRSRTLEKKATFSLPCMFYYITLYISCFSNIYAITSITRICTIYIYIYTSLSAFGLRRHILLLYPAFFLLHSGTFSEQFRLFVRSIYFI